MRTILILVLLISFPARADALLDAIYGIYEDDEELEDEYEPEERDDHWLLVPEEDLEIIYDEDDC